MLPLCYQTAVLLVGVGLASWDSNAGGEGIAAEVTRGLLLLFITMNIFGLVTLTSQLFYLRQGLAIHYEVSLS